MMHNYRRSNNYVLEKHVLLIQRKFSTPLCAQVTCIPWCNDFQMFFGVGSPRDPQGTFSAARPKTQNLQLSMSHINFHFKTPQLQGEYSHFLLLPEFSSDRSRFSLWITYSCDGGGKVEKYKVQKIETIVKSIELKLILEFNFYKVDTNII